MALDLDAHFGIDREQHLQDIILWRAESVIRYTANITKHNNNGYLHPIIDGKWVALAEAMENVQVKLAGAHEEAFYTTLQRHHLQWFMWEEGCDADVTMLQCVEKDDLETNEDSKWIHCTRYCHAWFLTWIAAQCNKYFIATWLWEVQTWRM